MTGRRRPSGEGVPGHGTRPRGQRAPSRLSLASRVLLEGIPGGNGAGLARRRPPPSASAGAWEVADRLRGRSTAGRRRRAVVDVLKARRFQPSSSAEGIRLGNCPFHALVDDYRATVCSLNLALLRGVVEGCGAADLRPEPTPAPPGCRVFLRSARPDLPAVAPTSQHYSRAGDRRHAGHTARTERSLARPSGLFRGLPVLVRIGVRCWPRASRSTSSRMERPRSGTSSSPHISWCSSAWSLRSSASFAWGCGQRLRTPSVSRRGGTVDRADLAVERPCCTFINDIPQWFFLLVHVVIFLFAIVFGAPAFGAGERGFGWGFTFFALQR